MTLAQLNPAGFVTGFGVVLFVVLGLLLIFGGGFVAFRRITGI